MNEITFTLFGSVYLVPWFVDKLFLAGIIGFLIGLERETKGKEASLRTFTVISLGSCLFTVLSIEASGGLHSMANGDYDFTRIAAQIVTGVGFLGGGVIFKTKDKIEGITTGAMIWLTAAIGMACGFGRTEIVFWAFVVAFILHSLTFFTYKLLYFGDKGKQETINNGD